MPAGLDFRTRSRLRRAFYSKPITLILIVVLVVFSRAAWGMYEKSAEAREKRDKAEAMLTGLEAREAELKTDIDRLSTERGIEEEIRMRHMVAKEGENVIIVRDPEAKASHRTIVVPDTPSFWDKAASAIGFSNE